MFVALHPVYLVAHGRCAFEQVKCWWFVRRVHRLRVRLTGAEPVAGAQHAAVQRLQDFLWQSTRDSDEVNGRRLELLVGDRATAPHARRVTAIDDPGDRKDGTATAHVDRQWLGRYGKTDYGIVTVTTV